MRILGYDTSYFDSDRISSLIIAGLREGRIILTKNSRLSRHMGVRTVYIEDDFVKGQLRQVINELNLKPDEEDMFTRCVICNILLEGAKKQTVRGKVPTYVFQTQQEFVRCPICGRIYWQGTHWGNVQKYLSQITHE